MSDQQQKIQKNQQVQQAIQALDAIYALSTRAAVPLNPDHLHAQQQHRFLKGFLEQQIVDVKSGILPAVEKKDIPAAKTKKLLVEKEEG